MAAEFKITGLEPALAKMREVTAQVTLKAVRGSASKAMRVVRDAARANARRLNDPATSEDIAKNIAVSTKVYPRQGMVVSRVGVRGGAKARKGGGAYQVGGSKENPGGDTFYWRFLELGTSKMPARPFMRPALENNVDKVVGTFVEDLSGAIEKAVARTK